MCNYVTQKATNPSGTVNQHSMGNNPNDDGSVPTLVDGTNPSEQDCAALLWWYGSTLSRLLSLVISGRNAGIFTVTNKLPFGPGCNIFTEK